MEVRIEMTMKIRMTISVREHRIMFSESKHKCQDAEWDVEQGTAPLSQ